MLHAFRPHHYLFSPLPVPHFLHHRHPHLLPPPSLAYLWFVAPTPALATRTHFSICLSSHFPLPTHSVSFTHFPSLPLLSAPCMADPRDKELTSLRDELAASKQTSDRRIETLRKQLSEAKQRAKEVIHRQRKDAEQRISSLEDDLRMRSDELQQVKSLLRQATDEKEGLLGQADILKNEIRDLSSRVSLAHDNLNTSKNELVQVQTASHQVVVERDRLQTQLALVRNELATLHSSTKGDTSSSITVSTVSKQTTGDQQHTSDNEHSADVEQNVPDAVDDNVPSTNISEELALSNQRETQLSAQLDNVQNQLKANVDEHKIAMDHIKSQNSDLEKSISKAQVTIEELQSNLEKSETALREEREKAERTKKMAAENPSNSEEAKNILEAKMAEMERLVASKQAEIGRVRDKARTYLKELNAEKREMEEKNKEKVQALEKKISDERDKTQAADARADSASKEIDSCLAVIRDKQKSVQMLTMTVSTLKSAARDAEREMHSLQNEFSRYKERARLALEEKQNVTETRHADIEAATVNIRSELERSRKEKIELKKHLLRVQQTEQQLEEMRERAERAEAAVDLLRSDATGVASTNFTRVDRLEEKIAQLESDLASARSAVDDAELRNSTTKMRLEAADRALHIAEVRAEEMERTSSKTIQALRTQVVELQGDLNRAKYAAESAQRTAAAAAKALTFSTAGDEEKDDVKGSPKDKMREARSPRDMSLYEHDRTNGQLSTFAKAMERESDRLGLSPRKIDSRRTSADGVSLSEDDVKARDQQIIVLTSQVAELGMLLDEVQQESQLRAEQTALLKEEVKNLDAKLAAAEKLKNGAPFSYLRTIVQRYLETDDSTLLPVICNVLSFSDEESTRIKNFRGVKGAKGAGPSPKSGYFSLPFLGPR